MRKIIFVKGLMRTLDVLVRHNETILHQQHVAALTRLYVDRFGINSLYEYDPHDRGEIAEIAGSVHDIGKVAIMDTLIRTMDMQLGLDSEEILLIRTHPEIGSRFICKLKAEIPYYIDTDYYYRGLLCRISEGVLSHHEQWDGSGYPQGLKGDEIPELARVLSVADAIDAMSQISRPWRFRKDREEIIAEIRAMLGIQFDPEIGTKMISLL